MNRTHRRSAPGGATIGLLSAAAALGGGEFVAGLVPSWQSPVVGVAEATIDRVPKPVKDFAIERFGTNDKVALVVGILVTSALLGVLLGIIGRRRPAVAFTGLAAFALVGAWASQQLSGAPISAVVPSVIGGAIGIAVFVALRRSSPMVPGGAPDLVGPEDLPTPTLGRRSFVLMSAGVAGTAGLFAIGGRALRRRFDVGSSRANVMLPEPVEPLAVAPPGVAADAPGISSFFTPNETFYRIDTALAVPQVRAEDWRLRIHGMVERELSITFDELLARPVVEADITLTCVSNTVGGQLVGNARWLGVRLDDLIAEAGVSPDATQLVGRSVDGYTCGFPLAALDGRTALVAIGMNGEPLPVEHGFPARLIVPGLYGYVSATKWLTEIELTTFDAFDQYWVERGWDREAPIKTMARIDTPKTLAEVAAGTVVIGGVAWAQTKGIIQVEIAIDDGPFVPVTLADELSVDTWRQWSFPWEASAGRHRLTVRATDATGALQTDQRADPFPNGASGWMSIFVDVAD